MISYPVMFPSPDSIPALKARSMCGNRATGVPAATYGSGSGAGNPSFRMLYNTFRGSWGRDCGAGVRCLVGICEVVGSGCPAMPVSADIDKLTWWCSVVWRRPYVRRNKV